MLKDITLGQYFPGNTIVHRLDPRTKLIAVVLYIAALFTANNWSATALVLLTLVFCVALSRIRPKALFKGLKPLIVIVILTAVLNLFYSDGNVICSFWVLRITDNGCGMTAEELERSFKTGYAEDGEMTFEEFASRWLKRQTKYAPSTIAAYRRMLEVVYPMIGGIRLNKLRPMALENMLSELRKRKHHGKRINESTAQRYLSVVSAVLSDAKRNEIIEKNPARMLDLPTPQRTVQRIPTRSEVEKLLDALAKEPRHYRLFYLLSMYTGCRRGELCALQWSDFTGTQNGLLLTVSRSRSSVPGKGIVEGSTKNGKSREVYLSSDLRGILLAYKRRKQMEADKQRRKLSPYLFTDEQGQLIHPDTFTKRLRKIYAAIGFPREYHLHTLRHYFVTSLLHCGVDKQTVADLVGHADTGFLERTYCHPQQAQKEQAADSMLTMLRPDGEQIFNLVAACSPKRHSA